MAIICIPGFIQRSNFCAIFSINERVCLYFCRKPVSFSGQNYLEECRNPFYSYLKLFFLQWNDRLGSHGRGKKFVLSEIYCPLWKNCDQTRKPSKTQIFFNWQKWNGPLRGTGRRGVLSTIFLTSSWTTKLYTMENVVRYDKCPTSIRLGSVKNCPFKNMVIVGPYLTHDA